MAPAAGKPDSTVHARAIKRCLCVLVLASAHRVVGPALFVLALMLLQMWATSPLLSFFAGSMTSSTFSPTTPRSAGPGVEIRE
jgi:hypothetical protein